MAERADSHATTAKGLMMSSINEKVVASPGKQRHRRGHGGLLGEGGAAVVLGARRTERLDEIARDIRERGGRAVTLAPM